MVESETIKDMAIEEIIKNEVRLEMFLLLILIPELNVTQISNYLNRSKSTVGRHLIYLNEQGILDKREVEMDGRYNPIYYRIADQVKNEIRNIFSSEDSIPTSQTDRKDFYRLFIENTRVLTKLIMNSFELILPFLNHKSESLTNIESADESLHSLFYPLSKFNLQTVVLSEKMLPEFWKEYDKFKSKIISLAENEEKQGEQKEFLFFDSLLPLKEILTYKKD